MTRMAWRWRAAALAALAAGLLAAAPAVAHPDASSAVSVSCALTLSPEGAAPSALLADCHFYNAGPYIVFAVFEEQRGVPVGATFSGAVHLARRQGALSTGSGGLIEDGPLFFDRSEWAPIPIGAGTVISWTRANGATINVLDNPTAMDVARW